MSSKQVVPKWHSKIGKFMEQVEKRTKVRDVFVTPTFRVECVNSGSTVLNMLIGGSRLPDGSFVCPGWPRGRISEVYGKESSGKSTIAMAGMGMAIKDGGCGFYVDLEHAVVDNYAMRLGCDFRPPELGGSGMAVRAQPHTFEEAEALVTMAALNGVDFIVVDSVAGLVPRHEASRDTTDEKQKQAVALVPRMMAQWMPKLQAIIARTKSHVMFLNQTRDKIGAIGYTEEALKSTTGGNALKFWASVRVLLKPKMTTKAKRFNPITKDYEEVQISTDVEAKMIKNKIDAKQGHSGLLTLCYGVGVDELRTMLNVAEAYNIIKASKNTKRQDVYSFTNPETGENIEEIGMEKFRLALKGNAPMMKCMTDAAIERIMLGYRMIDDEQLAALASDAINKRVGDGSGSEDDDNDQEGQEGPDMEAVANMVPGVDYQDLTAET